MQESFPVSRAQKFHAEALRGDCLYAFRFHDFQKMSGYGWGRVYQVKGVAVCTMCGGDFLYSICEERVVRTAEDYGVGTSIKEWGETSFDYSLSLCS